MKVVKKRGDEEENTESRDNATYNEINIWRGIMREGEAGIQTEEIRGKEEDRNKWRG